MSLEQEKRQGNERRIKDGRQQGKEIERRTCSERRQTSIAEISYFEWASHFIRFHGRALGQKVANNAEGSNQAPDPA